MVNIVYDLLSEYYKEICHIVVIVCFNSGSV